MKNFVKKAVAVLFSLCLLSGSLFAFDFEAEYDADDIAFKKELIYIISKADALYRRFKEDGITESLVESVQADEDVFFVVMNEMRYADFREAMMLEEENSEVVETSQEEVADEQ